MLLIAIYYDKRDFAKKENKKYLKRDLKQRYLAQVKKDELYLKKDLWSNFIYLVKVSNYYIYLIFF